MAMGLLACSGGASHPTQPAPTTTTGVIPAAGFTTVVGRAISARLEPTTIESEKLTGSFHIELLVRGAASASLRGVTIDGNAASIAWSGATPIEFRGPSAAVTTPVPVDITGTGVLAHLDGASIVLAAGPWHLTGAVAVGTGGLAASRDAADFVVPAPGATLNLKGGAGLRMPPATRTFEGPGRVSLDGTFDVRTATAKRTLAHVRAGPTPYKFTVTWKPDGIAVDGTVQGEVVAG